MLLEMFIVKIAKDSNPQVNVSMISAIYSDLAYILGEHCQILKWLYSKNEDCFFRMEVAMTQI